MLNPAGEEGGESDTQLEMVEDAGMVAAADDYGESAHSEDEDLEDDGTSQVSISPQTTAQGAELVGMAGLPVNAMQLPMMATAGVAAAGVAAQSQIANRKRKQPPQFGDVELVDVIIEGQLHQLHPETRMTVVSKTTGKKLAGNTVPRARNVAEWLAQHIDYKVVVAPAAASRRRNKPSAKAAAMAKPYALAKSSAVGKRQPKKRIDNRTKIPFPLAESLEEGPGGDYIWECKRMYRESKRLLDANQFESAADSYDTAIHLAELAVRELVEAQARLRSFPNLTTDALATTWRSKRTKTEA